MDELKRLGHPAWTLLEAAPVPGGLGSSVVDPAGFTWDLGGHVVFSHFGEFDRLLAELFTAGELLHHDRSSYIRFRARWVPCPFQHSSSTSITSRPRTPRRVCTTFCSPAGGANSSCPPTRTSPPGCKECTDRAWWSDSSARTTPRCGR
ncbi:FAD-dependent oxidoreductase [Streptomyces albogriseolus]|uniref:FAD-dependent oxidoreductase n=1 Tax=Streptomyces albogriseolus TaxID=1887 RepID=UPI00345FE6D0